MDNLDAATTSQPLYKSLKSYKWIAYFIYLIFVVAGVRVFLESSFLSILFIFIGGLHLLLIKIYIVEIEFYQDSLQILKNKLVITVPYRKVLGVRQITYCTGKLWYLRISGERKLFYFFASKNEIKKFIGDKFVGLIV